MNWQKAMEATFEFKQFLQTEEAKTNPVHGAIVFFEKFDGSGWQRTPQCRVLQDGWNEWYRYFSKIDGIGSVDLIRLQNDLLGHYESEKVAASILALAESLPEEQREILRAAMFSDENPPRTI